MSLINRTFTFTDGTTAYGSQVDSEVANIVNTLNNLDAGTTSWDIVKTVNSSSVPLIADNSTGSNDVADFKVNGTTKVSVDGTGNLQLVTATATTNVTGLTARLPQYRKPVLQYNSATVVNIETGLTGTSGQSVIVFPDGSVRTDSTTTRIQCNLAQVAALTSTAQSGLRTGTVANNTWYAIYAVKSQVNSTDIVAVADTVLPLQANYATLNSNFGTNSWVYLGMVRNGDNAGSATGILAFSQEGAWTTFSNAATSEGEPGTGVRLKDTAVAAASMAMNYAAGTGAGNIPDHIKIGCWLGAYSNPGSATVAKMLNNSGTVCYARLSYSSTWIVSSPVTDLTAGLQLSSAINVAYSMFLASYMDGALGVGANPLL